MPFFETNEAMIARKTELIETRSYLFNLSKAKNVYSNFIVSNIDSKTKGFKRFTDCFEFANRPPRISINISMLGDRRYRI